MKFYGPLLAVEDMKRSREFYETVLSLTVIQDFGANITFDGGISLQTKETWVKFLHKTQADILTRPNNAELYFEEEAFDAFCEKLKARGDISLVNDTEIAPWGQKTIRFYDPDGHIIEVSQTMESVARGFRQQGMAPLEIAQRMDVELDYVNSLLNAT